MVSAVSLNVKPVYCELSVFFQRVCRPRLHRRVQHSEHVVDESAGELAGWRILREMVRHVWPQNQPRLKARVVIALGLLIGAKVGWGS